MSLANKEGFTPCEVKQAELVKRLFHMAGAPNMRNFKYFVDGRNVSNCPINHIDVKNASKIYGQDMYVLKGRGKKAKPLHLTADYIAIPPELTARREDIELFIDTMFVNQMPFLTGIDHPIYNRDCVPLDSQISDELFRGLDRILRHYNECGFRIKKIHCDGQFQHLLDTVKDELHVELNCCMPGDHVHAAE